MQAEQALVERTPLVFAADQTPFQVATGHRFCILHPLMTADGKRLSADREHFPNRGRVWWMLREEIRDEWVVPGSLWTGKLQRAVRTERTDGDMYQVVYTEIMPGGPELVEILDLRAQTPDVAWVQREIPIPWPRPTPARVMLLGQGIVLGPLHAIWDPKARLLSLKACSTAEPQTVLRVPAEAFFGVARTERFSVPLCHFDNAAEERTTAILLSRMDWLDLPQLRTAGEELDASTDSQLINWATKHLNVSRVQVAPLRLALADIARDKATATDKSVGPKLRRVQELTEDAERVGALGEEVAQVLGSTPAFAELVLKHTEVIAGRRVEELVKLRSGEIDKALEARTRELRQVESDLKNITAEYERRAAEKEEELRQQVAARMATVEERERKADLRDKALAEQEADLVGRLERVIDRYRQEADRVGDELLAQLPFLKKLGFGGGGTVKVEANGSPPPTELTLPAFLREKKPGGAELAEADFLDQFRRVVEHKGFTFAPEDLVNFHVCLKTGGLTILAGPSGTGKSSLPRFYAEALGCADEYLHVAVRPDWLDDRDLVGAFNALAQRFEPSGSGLVEHLIAAALDRQQGRGGIYLVCLDEMNLARVEHYFAQFLSVLELPAEHRHLSLFAPGLVRPTDPYAKYQRLPLGANLRFVGTVNIDETTHFFSPKVLDRCQVVAFAAPDLAAPRRKTGTEAPRGLRPVGLSTYAGWCREPPADSSARKFLLQVNEVLRHSHLGLGFRQFDRVLCYVQSARPFLSEDQALDFQLKQVILPRLRNTAPHFEQTVRELTQLVPGERFPRSAALLARVAEARAEDDYFQLL